MTMKLVHLSGFMEKREKNVIMMFNTRKYNNA